jgi:hypothetical protein
MVVRGDDDATMLAVGHAELRGCLRSFTDCGTVSSYVWCMMGITGTTVLMSIPLRVFVT